jgi:hypothetical protein
MVKKNNYSIIVIISLLVLSVFFIGNFNIADIVDIGQETSCKIVKDSCNGYTECEIIEYQGETIACINGYLMDTEVFEVFDPKETYTEDEAPALQEGESEFNEEQIQ